MVKRFVFAVPGDLATPTGGYAYDRRMIAELGDLGWRIDLLDLGEGFPWPDEATRAAAQTRLLAMPAGRCIVIDGLALGVLPETASRLAGRNPLLALVHHPLALEWGLSAAQAEALRANLAGLPGFGEMKIKALGAVLAKRFGVAAAEGLVPWHPTLGDVDSAQALADYQAAKRVHKAEWSRARSASSER